MKAKIAPRKEIVLLYQSEKIEGSDRLFALLTQMQIPYKEVAASELGQTTGTLAGYRSDPQEEAAVQPQTPAMAMGGLAGKRLDQLLNAMRQQQIDLPVKMVITQHNERWPFGTLIEEVGREHQLFVAMERLQRLCKRAQQVEGFDPILIKRAQDVLSRMRSEQEAPTREELEGLSDQLESLLG